MKIVTDFFLEWKNTQSLVTATHTMYQCKNIDNDDDEEKWQTNTVARCCCCRPIMTLIIDNNNNFFPFKKKNLSQIFFSSKQNSLNVRFVCAISVYKVLSFFYTFFFLILFFVSQSVSVDIVVFLRKFSSSFFC